jgi:hypothetical protein
MVGRAPLVEGTRELLACLAPWLRQISIFDWDGPQGFQPVIRRSLLRRQFDSLEVAAELAESNRGYAAVPLLRPACEELLWLRYFNTLEAGDARILVDCLIESGLLDDLEAQVIEVGEGEMAEMGLLPVLAFLRSKEPDIRQKLKQPGRRLGWPRRVVDDGKLPSTWFIAKTNEESNKLYRFLYHATSRYVHFSAIELARRGWGKPGRLELSSGTYEPIWAEFSLAWGTRLLVWTLEASIEALRAEGAPEPDYNGLQVAFDRVAEVPLIPLVTPDELQGFR